MMKADFSGLTAAPAATADFSVRAISTLAALRELEPEWNRLWSLSAERLPFQHYGWIFSFAETLGAQTPWQILVVERGGTIHALLPLARIRSSQTWRLLGSPNADYQDIISDPACASPALHAMLDYLRRTGARGLLCQDVPAHSPLKRVLDESRYIHAETRPPCPCPVLHLSTDLLAAHLRRSGVKDNERRIARLGSVEFRVIQDPTERVAAMELLFTYHRARWSTPGHRTQFDDPAACSFFRRLCREPSLHTMLHVSQLLVDGAVIATHLGFATQERFIYYKPAFDPAKKGAGQVLLNRLLEEALRTGTKEFDFTRGGEGYKTHLATGSRMNHTIHVFFSTRGYLWHALLKWLRRHVPRDHNGVAIPAKWVRRLLQSGGSTGTAASRSRENRP